MEKFPQDSGDEMASDRKVSRRDFLRGIGAAAAVGMFGTGLGSEARAEGAKFTFTEEELSSSMSEVRFKSIEHVRAWLEAKGVDNVGYIQSGIIGAEDGEALTGNLAVISPQLEGFENVNQIALRKDYSLRWVRAPEGQALSGNFSGIKGLKNKIEEKVSQLSDSGPDNKIILDERLLQDRELSQSKEDLMKVNNLSFEGAQIEVTTVDDVSFFLD